MKYFKTAYGLLLSRLLFNIIIVLEIAAALILTNAVIANVNSKDMLYKPVKDILKNDGLLIDVMDVDFEENEVIDSLRKKYGWNDGYVDCDVLSDYVEKKLAGDVKVYRASDLQFIEGGPTFVDKLSQTSNLDIYLTDDEIFNKFRLPLSSGRWASAEKNSDGEIEIVVTPGTNAKLNDVYETSAGKIRVVGILTDNTYAPPGASNSHHYDQFKFLGIFDFVNVYDASIKSSPFAIADKNLFKSPQTYGNVSDYFWFVSYGEGLSKDDVKKNDEFLLTYIGKPANELEDGTYETFKDLDEATQRDINQIYLKMLPMILAALIVVLAGLTGSVAISTVKQMKTFGIFFLCGCCWKDCIKIISAQLAIIFGVSSLLSVIGLEVMQLLNLNASIGLSFKMNNLIASLIILAVMYLLAVILPKNIIKTSSPVETIKENV